MRRQRLNIDAGGAFATLAVDVVFCTAFFYLPTFRRLLIFCGLFTALFLLTINYLTQNTVNLPQ